ncbi:hypothetical protein Tco_0496503 [Tanacetum coccineum]
MPGNPEAMKLILDNIFDQESRTPPPLPTTIDDKPGKAIAKEEAPSKSAKIQLFPETPTDTKNQPTPIAKAEATGTQLAKTKTQGQSTKRQKFHDPSTERKKEKGD